MSTNWPDLLVLELLVGVDDHGSLSAAARNAGVAQPNASRMMKQLEHGFGSPLLERRPSGATLTAHGRVLAHWARRVLDSATQLREVAAGLQSAHAAELTVGASMTVAEHLMPRWLGSFRDQHPEVSLHLQVHNSARVFEQVAAGDYDVGFVEAPAIPAGLHSVTVAKDRLVVVVSRSHPWARRRRPLTISELAGTPLLVREPGSGTRTTLELALHQYEPVPPLLELGSSAAIKTSVLGGIGPAVLSTLAVADQVHSGELRAVRIDGLDLSRSLRAVWRPPRQLTGHGGDLVNLARREFRASQHPDTH